jgi:hypothetical protein
MDWIEAEPFGFVCPDFADELIGCETFEDLEPAAEIVCGDEVDQMLAELVVIVAVEAFDVAPGSTRAQTQNIPADTKIDANDPKATSPCAANDSGSKAANRRCGKKRAGDCTSARGPRFEDQDPIALTRFVSS